MGSEQGIRMRRRLVLGGFVLLVVLVYVAVVLLYAANSRSETGGSGGLQETDDVLVVLSPVAVNGPGERLSLDVQIYPPESMVDKTDQITLTQDLSVIISPVDGTQSIDLDKGSLVRLTKSVSVAASGTVEKWPFDRYDTDMAIIAYSVTDGVRAALPTYVQWQGSLSGWNFDAYPNYDIPITVTTADGQTEDLPTIHIGAARSGSTFAFGFLLLGLLVVMPVLVLFVAIRAFTGRRKVEATLTSWMGAMLFAVVPLRGFLPGSPPIGSWIDFLVVLWVIVALITGLSIYVLAWNRWGTPATPPSPVPGGAPSEH